MAGNTLRGKRLEEVNRERSVTESRAKERGAEGAEQRLVLSLRPSLNSEVGAGFLLISSPFVNYPRAV